MLSIGEKQKKNQCCENGLADVILSFMVEVRAGVGNMGFWSRFRARWVASMWIDRVTKILRSKALHSI